ncbi:unknown protein [Microcystis aeruginosa NIES-843]|uniref:Uncharacterized protein n=1 Tax=Microcystis aeruginosa (strain NIES-843 / IAM M-2473) TaxID=449447 RepID=B0JV18_MICAN|nr:unknown protein [Microcystis aeruginosa NIES-843]
MTLKLLQIYQQLRVSIPPKSSCAGGSGEALRPPTGGLGRVDSFKLSTADFESINLNENSQVYLFLIKRVSDNN